MKPLLNWLDHRTGIKGVVRGALYEHIPGGARWRYVWGSTLVFAFTVQAITGIFLWMAYSPGGQTAWESVYYIQHEMQGGWFLRGLHHFMAQAMIVLLALHLLQVVIDGAYRAPREVNFWLGLILMQIVLGLSLTGYLLPWDQKGFWATRVATNLMGLVPGVGGELQKIVVGGRDYGHHTLTRFFALHAGVLPALLIGLLVIHVALFRRHGLKHREPVKRPDATFWPDQILKDGVACLAVLAVVTYFIVRPGLPSYLGGHQAAWTAEHLGAELGAPADPSEPYAAARPEWYFLFLFQFLKLFEGEQEVFGAIVVPGMVMGALFLMPLLGRWKLGHRFNVGLLVVLLGGVGFLTYRALDDDYRAAWRDKPPSTAEASVQEKHDESEKFLDAVESADQDAERVKQLIARPHGDEGPALIPVAGAVSLLRDDPKTQGPRIFERYCASCHSHTGGSGRDIVSETPVAPNLGRYGSREWLDGLFDPQQIGGPDYFGNTHVKEGDMAGWVTGTLPEVDEEQKAGLEKIKTALAAEAGLPSQKGADPRNVPPTAETGTLMVNVGCADCHKFHDTFELGTAPDLTGWASRDWLIGMISNPSHERYYAHLDAEKQPMPAFAKNADKPDENTLSPRQLGLLVDWLRGDWYEPPQSAAAR